MDIHVLGGRNSTSLSEGAALTERVLPVSADGVGVVGGLLMAVDGVSKTVLVNRITSLGGSFTSGNK